MSPLLPPSSPLRGSSRPLLDTTLSWRPSLRPLLPLVSLQPRSQPLPQAAAPSLTWKTDSPGGRSPDTGSCSPPGLALGTRRGAGISGEGVPSASRSPPGKRVRDLGLHRRPLSPRISPNPRLAVLARETLGALAWKPGPTGGKAMGSGLFPRHKDGRCLASLRTISQFLSWCFRGYRNSGSTQSWVELGPDACHVTLNLNIISLK